jgi:hypothetical protein
MLSAALPLLEPAAAGLASVPFGRGAAPAMGLLGLAAAAAFAALVGMHAPAPADDASGVARRADAAAGWTTGLGRPVAAVCAVAFGLKGALCGGLAWQVWELQGPGGAIGLAAAALVFVTGALVFAGRALGRR